MSPTDLPAAAGDTALVIIDMINRLDFEGAETLAAAAEALVGPILTLRDAADRAGVPVVYVNDNHGQWHSERDKIIAAVVDDRACRGRNIAERLRPRENDYFMIKPQFSGFYSTNLPVLLPQLHASRLILTGLAADICVLFTAADAHMRAYELWVPSDAVASEDAKRTDWALEIMRQSMSADTCPTTERTMDDWIARAGG